MVTVLACAFLNRNVSAFWVAEGVALVFPASAVTVVASLLLGWWGVAGALVGFLLTPWGLSTTVARTVFFACAAALQGAIPLLVGLRAEGSTRHRVLRALTWAAVLNTLISAIIAAPGIAMATGNSLVSERVVLAFTGWFVADMTAILLFAFPVLILIRPRLLLDDFQIGVLQSWGRHRGISFVTIAMVVAAAVTMELTVSAGDIHIHWIALLFLAPVLLAAATGAVGAGLLVNGLAGVVYVAQVLRLLDPGPGTELFRDVIPSYLNLLAFAVAAVVTGVYAGTTRALLAELDSHRRLLQKDFERVVTALAAAIEAKDPTTQGHVQRVSRLAVIIGERLGIAGQRLEMLRYASILHDIGKIGVPEEVLNKKGPLTPDEFKILERHVTIGVDILQSIDILAPAIPLIRYHQERWDGRTDTRYPGYHGLKGEEIPLEARIISVVDAWDAMTNDRPYRAAMSEKHALKEICNEAGAQFDPDVVNALTGIVGEDLPEETSGRWPVLGGAEPPWFAEAEHPSSPGG